MGGRVSVPRGPDGLSEGSRPTRPPRGGIPFNARTFMAPMAAFTMAGLLFVYTRTSIRAAKLNAQKHREADGGQISWQNESRRRHHQAEQVGETSAVLKEAFFGSGTAKDIGSKESSVDASADDREREALERLERAKAGRRG
ncbi:uncharacterized protein K452DRAFT_249372 [Aplosporella prunicola CBS 121167]|uniref:Uncharacterized protein n=1 Tax=Aplosporella prunicola CBS 121167 TaxID=1176127 RepID=A0A6A6BGX1_9PEZI|nr:uncharacterized protein K452DRAFT_249372 [Aplosporella prunicola CBS 121167]KAF2142565.1 hypothetical protein K452DRAFT_249372 [Aplosporella prunicola CBS 121167]